MLVSVEHGPVQSRGDDDDPSVERFWSRLFFVAALFNFAIGVPLMLARWASSPRVSTWWC